MNFNFKIRAKNPLYWVAIIVSMLTYIGGYLGVKGEDVTSWSTLFGILGDVISNPYLLVMIIVTMITTAISYTDKGIKDTGFVQSLEKPRDDKDPEQAAGFLSEEHDKPVPMPPEEHGEKDLEDDFDEAEPIEKLDSETPIDDVKDEDKENSPKG